jgi:hypothetical protein
MKLRADVMTPETTEIKNRHSSSRHGAVRGCVLTALALFIFDLVVCAGLGQSKTYWHEIGPVQIFEGTDSVIAFVEISQATHRPGLIRSPANVRIPARLLRIEVGRDGSVKQALLPSEPHIDFNNVDSVLKLADAFYLMNGPSSGQRGILLNKIDGDHIEPLSADEADEILRSEGLLRAKPGIGSQEQFDRVLEKREWRRVGGWRSGIWILPKAVDCDRLKIRLRGVKSDLDETLTAESLGDGERWVKSLLTVNTRSQRSYGSPPPLEPQ